MNINKTIIKYTILTLQSTCYKFFIVVPKSYVQHMRIHARKKTVFPSYIGSIRVYIFRIILFAFSLHCIRNEETERKNMLFLTSIVYICMTMKASHSTQKLSASAVITGYIASSCCIFTCSQSHFENK